MRLSRSSGLDFLDEAAMDAFRRAAKDGTVLFPFGFYLEHPVPPSQRDGGVSDAGAVSR